MDRHRSLRTSLLLALGAAGCSSAAAPAGGDVAGNPTVVQIPTPSSAGSAAAAPPEPDEPDRPRSQQTGWVTEKDGTAHRAKRTRCDPAVEAPACNGDEHLQRCKRDADCKDGPHGHCITGIGQVGSYCACVYACASDNDCGAGEACVCKGTGRLREQHSVCARAECSVDADCPEGTCGLSAYFNGCSEQVSLACRSKDDACKADADCQSGGRGGRGESACVARPGAKGGRSRWMCASAMCVVGRPLLIDGAARTAAPAARADWSASAALAVDSLAPDVRAALVDHYTAQASLEHASVASFARFSLQLLALGAPADLIADAQRAALDEVEHARIAYGIASQLAGRRIGPGPLPEAVAPLSIDVAAVVEALVEEGCVGETLGAAEGREIALHAGDAALAQAFARIAADEERHAALAFRTLQWMLIAFGEPARAAAERAFARACARHAVDPEAGLITYAPLGLLSAEALGRLRREVLDEVAAPLFAAASS